MKLCNASLFVLCIFRSRQVTCNKSLILDRAITRPWCSDRIKLFHRHETRVASKNLKLAFIPVFQSSYILLETNRSPSQLSVELLILKIGPVILVRFSQSKVLQKAVTETYSFLVKYQSCENPEIPKITCKLFPVAKHFLVSLTG